jgi:hypothetical protein
MSKANIKNALHIVANLILWGGIGALLAYRG